MSFLFLALPSFLFIIYAKCVNLFSYKKLDMTNKSKRFIIIVFLLLVAAYLLNTIIPCLLWSSLEGTWKLLAFFAPLSLPILSLIPVYLLERKCIEDDVQKKSIKKAFFVLDFISSFAFSLSSICFGFWSMMTFGEFGLFGEKVDNTKQDTVLFIGLVVLFIIFALIKIAIQKGIIRRKTKVSITLSTHTQYTGVA